MRIKPFFIVFLLFLFIVSGHLSAQEQDFFGTWTCKFNHDGDIYLVEIRISRTSFVVTTEIYDESDLIDEESWETEIISWARITNADPSTRTTYPNGYRLEAECSCCEMEYPEDIIEIFISRDGRQLIIPEFNELLDQRLVFRKR